MKTARIVCEQLGIGADSYSQSDLLAEHDYGQWEGLIDSEIEDRFPGQLERRRRNHWDYVVPGRESYAMVHQRVAAWMAEAVSGTVIVVAHEMVSRVMRGIYLRLDHEQTLALTHPHEVIILLRDGTVAEIRPNPGAGEQRR